VSCKSNATWISLSSRRDATDCIKEVQENSVKAVISFRSDKAFDSLIQEQVFVKIFRS
jgi:hypothetical protein